MISSLSLLILTLAISSLLTGQALAGTPPHNGPYAPWNEKVMAVNVN